MIVPHDQLVRLLQRKLALTGGTNVTVLSAPCVHRDEPSDNVPTEVLQYDEHGCYTDIPKERGL